MQKRLSLLIGLILVGIVVLVGCSTEPETIIQTVESVSEVEVTRMVTEAVEVTRVVTEEVVVEVPVDSEAPAAPGETFGRGETLYTSGTQWGPPSSWNPFNTGNYAMGTIGLCYETLFLYDPLTNEYIPWLAESGDWVDDNVYEVTVRDGISWSDGEPFSAADVRFTFELGREAPVNISTVWDWLDSIEEVDENTLRFNFSETLYQQWGNTLYTTAIVPEHIWSEMSVEEITAGANENPVCSGPYVYDSHDQSRMIWVKGGNWWATDALGLDVAPTRIVDIVNGSNNVALGMVLQGGLDLSNNFLPGIATLVEGGYGVETYYPEPPYMLSANTAWLLTNNTTPPLDDPEFRKALAYAIDVNQIVQVVYGNIVQASNPTGLLPIWEQYIDQDVVDELGFGYDPEMARQLLADAGYTDGDGDGFVEMPDGTPIELSVIVPFGWSDWMESIRVVSNSAQAVGINVVTEFPEYPQYLDQRNSGTFDLMIANDAQMSNTPWTYYNWMFMNPIADIATLQNGNYGRYDNPEAFELVDQLDQVPVEDIAGMRAVMSELQRIHLTDMPLIPLWYNGLWSQVNTTHWTNWPSSADGANHYMPATWRGYWNMTSILMLTELEPVEAGQ